MKNIIIVLFFLIPSYLMAQSHQVCFTNIGCNDANEVYVDATYNTLGNVALQLSFVCDYWDFNTTGSVTFASTFQGVGSKRIIIPSIRCNRLGVPNELSIKYFDLGSTSSMLDCTFSNGLPSNNNCLNLFGDGNCNLLITATTTPKTCTVLGSVTTTVTGGTAPYSYKWSNGPVTSNLRQASAGTYSVTVTDVNGCSAVRSDIVVENRIFLITGVTQNKLCDRSLISLTLSGGTPPYTYYWSDATTESVFQAFSDNYSYSVIVTDANGCQATKPYIVIDHFLKISRVVAEPYVCSSSKGSAYIITNEGGTPPYSYQWNTGSTENPLNNLDPGTYTGTVTDANGCTATQDIYVRDESLNLYAQISHKSCTSTGTANVTPLTGTPPYTYRWSNGATTNSISNVAGTYDVTVTDGEGCVKTESIVVQNRVLSLLESVEPVTCNSLGSISLTPQNGTPPYTYNWSNGSTEATLQNLQAGTYTVTATDEGNCTIVKSITVASQVQNVTLNAVVEHINCTNSVGKISLTPSGGTAPYSYTWNNGATGSVLQNLQVGTYSVTATDVNGCKATKSVDIVNQVQVLTLNTVVEHKTCTNPFGKISVTVLGGLGPYFYDWGTGTGTRSTYSPPLQAGTHSIKVTDENGCSAVKSNIIIEDKCQNTICIDQISLLTAPDGIQQNLYMTFTYAINSRTNLTPTSNSKITLFPGTSQAEVISFLFNPPQSGSGTQTVSLRIGWANANISTIMPIKIDYYYNNNLDHKTFDFTNGFCTSTGGCCIGKTCNLTATTSIPNLGSCSVKPTILAVASGGTPPYTYRWSSGGTTAQIGVPEGTYTVTVTDANACAVSKSITVANPCPIDCAKYIDNCRTEWEQFVLKNYAPGKCKQWEAACNLTSDIRRDGKVAIGYSLTSVPSGFNLAVQGSVLAKDVKVKLCRMGERWCDYVFDDKYKLMPLTEMSKYINQNKRLPNMPSTADVVKEGGYEIKKLTLLQQEKIEEAYLHLFKLEEKIKNLQDTIESKKQQNKKISQLLNK